MGNAEIRVRPSPDSVSQGENGTINGEISRVNIADVWLKPTQVMH